MTTILCYGDSNTHGTMPMGRLGEAGRFPKGERWPDVLALALGAGHEVIAEGLPGRTTVHDDPVEGGNRNGYSVLPAILHSHKPIGTLILMLGTNDLKTRFSVTSWEIARSVERLALMARAEAVVGRIVLVAPPPVVETGTLAEVFAGAERRQAGLAEHLARIAGMQGFGFIDAGRHVRVSAVDGVHWDAASHGVFGRVVARALRDME